MSYIKQIAHYLGVRSNVPNKKLAAQLAEEKNYVGIKEIASYLYDKNKSIASDCIDTLYETGYIAPELIADYSQTFIDLLDSNNNRMVWGAMIALSTIAKQVPEKIWPYLDKIKHHIETGTVITCDAGVRTLIGLCKGGSQYYSALYEELFLHLKTCRPKDCAKLAEDMWNVIQLTEQEEFLAILEERLPVQSKAAQKRMALVIKKLKTN